ncbi:MAG: diadenylate cyclase CdaA [Acidobacteriota bacterium]
MSLESFIEFLEPVSNWKDLLDLLMVTTVLYYLLLLIRGTRAVQVILGILVLVLIYTSARAFGLPALETTLENFFIILPVAIIVLFQHEIRRALASFGRTPFWGFAAREEVGDLFNDVVLAASTLSERKIGALIVFERREGLRNYIENGIQMDAIVSMDLLISVFHPDTPTHDGAVIIQGDRMAAASCFLPLTRGSELSSELGTRHRAALGISEETDALALVVSEETGAISVVVGGDMERRLSTGTLRTLLYKYLLSDSADDDPQRVLVRKRRSKDDGTAAAAEAGAP